MSKRPAGVILLLAALLPMATGCEFSHVNPKAAVGVGGRALDARGAPLAGVPVRLFKEADLGDALLGVVFVIGTLGAVCLVPGAPAICRQAKVATTAADGSYHFDLKGSDTQGLIGTVSTLDAVVAEPGGGDHGASTTISFKARTTDISLPDARLWAASPRLAQGAGHLHLTWAPLPPAYGQGVGYSALLFDPVRHGPLWSQPASGSSGDIDARVLEDVPATAAVQAGATLAAGTGDAHAAYLSPRLDVQPIAGAPPSRSRPCLAVAATNLTPVPQARCGVTDGDLVTPARLSAAEGLVISGVVVDLGASRPVGLVVVRGVAGQFLIEVSDDGAAYRQIATATGTASAVAPPGRTTARFVRVRSPGGLDESLMSEVSVW